MARLLARTQEGYDARRSARRSERPYLPTYAAGQPCPVHEAGLAQRAIDAAIAAAAGAGQPDRRPTGVDVVIDPGRVTADAIAFHLELALRERGFEGLDLTMTSESVACPTCGAGGSPDAWLLCETCGLPLPARDGPIVEARFRF